MTVHDDGERISVRFAYRADLYTSAFVRGPGEEPVEDVAAVTTAPHLPVPSTSGAAPQAAPWSTLPALAG